MTVIAVAQTQASQLKMGNKEVKKNNHEFEIFKSG